MGGNPWTTLADGPPYVAADDLAAIERFNAPLQASDPYRIRTDLLPEPYVGRPNADLVVLNLNPGFHQSDYDLHATPAFRAATLDNLNHRRERFPFYSIDPAFEGSPMVVWWRQHLRVLMGHVEADRLATNLLCIERMPYHSERFKRSPALLSLPSFAYAAELLRAAIRRDATILGMRARSLWLQSVPELAVYPRAVWLNNPQAVFVTPNNMSSTAWELVKRAAAGESV